MKRILVLIVALSFVCILETGIIPVPANAKAKFVNIGTGSVAGAYFSMGNAIAKVVNEKRANYGITVITETRPGAVERVKSIMAGDLAFGFIRSDNLYQAAYGLAEWKGKGPQEDLRAVFSSTIASITLVAAVDAEIKNIRDLGRKRVNIGTPGSVHRQHAIDALNAIGIDYTKDLKAEEIRASASPPRLQDGRIDAFFCTVRHPSALVMQAEAGIRKVRLVTINDVEEFLKEHPYYVKSFISHEYYKGFANDSDIETFGIKDTFIASAKLPDDIVFTFTKAVFDNINSLRKLQPAFQFLTKKGMLEGLPAPIHPGAIKYYKEVGLLK